MHESVDEHLLERLLQSNEELAEHNREHFEESGTFVLNFMSAPGAGKTMLIAATAHALADRFRICVIEGDMVGELDCERLRQLNIPAFQISTGRSCHLDARMVAQLLHERQLPDCQLVFIENVGNLVCPAEFPLGEHLRIVLLSVTEGDDKPFKYPVIFRRCDAVIFTKCDLLPHVDFSIERASRFVEGVNPDAAVFQVSAVSGQGLSAWVDWLSKKIAEGSGTGDRLRFRQDATVAGSVISASG
jgi:hydrogenase nickel incorporation protein HypB